MSYVSSVCVSSKTVRAPGLHKKREVPGSDIIILTRGRCLGGYNTAFIWLKNCSYRGASKRHVLKCAHENSQAQLKEGQVHQPPESRQATILQCFGRGSQWERVDTEGLLNFTVRLRELYTSQGLIGTEWLKLETAEKGPQMTNKVRLFQTPQMERDRT